MLRVLFFAQLVAAAVLLRRPTCTMGCGASGQRSFSSDYVIGAKVAAGTFSQTRLATDRKTGEVRAAKLRSAPYEVADCQFETELLSKLNHAGRSECTRPKESSRSCQAEDAPESEPYTRGLQYILRFYGAYSEKTFFCQVFELCEGGELMYLDLAKEVTEADVARWIRQLLMAVEALHIRSIVHRNVNSSSVFLREKERQNIRLGGFGLACRLSNHELLKDACGSTAYLAPEILIGNYGRKVDIWAVGVLLYIFLFGRFPFIAADTFRLFKNIIEEEPPWTYTPTRDLLWPSTDQSFSSLSSESFLCTAASPTVQVAGAVSSRDNSESVSPRDRLSAPLAGQAACAEVSGGQHQRERGCSGDTGVVAQQGARDGGEGRCLVQSRSISRVSCYSVSPVADLEGDPGSVSPPSRRHPERNSRHHRSASLIRECPGGGSGNGGICSPVTEHSQKGLSSPAMSPSRATGDSCLSSGTTAGSALEESGQGAGQDVGEPAKDEKPSHRDDSTANEAVQGRRGKLGHGSGTTVSEVVQGRGGDGVSNSAWCPKTESKERDGTEKTRDSSPYTPGVRGKTETRGGGDFESRPLPGGQYVGSPNHRTTPPSRGTTGLCHRPSTCERASNPFPATAGDCSSLGVSVSFRGGREGIPAASIKDKESREADPSDGRTVEQSANIITRAAVSAVREGRTGVQPKKDREAEGPSPVRRRGSRGFVTGGSPRWTTWRNGGDDDAYSPAPAAVELCKRLLHKNFLGRPTATEALAHPWLQEEAWANGRKGVTLPASLCRRITLCSTEMRLKNPSMLSAPPHQPSRSASHNVRGASTPAESPEPPRATSSPVSEPSEEGRTGFLPVCHKQTGDFSTNDSLALTWGGDGERHVYLGEPQDGPSFSRQCYSRGVSRKPSSSPPGHRTPEAPAFFFSPEKPFDVNEENMQLLGDALGKKVPAIEMRGGESHTRTEMGSRTTRRGSRSGSRVSLQLRLLKKNSVDENASGTEFESKRGISGGGSTKLFRRQQCSSPPARPDGRGAGLRISEGKKGRRATEPGVPKVGPSRHSRLEESAYEAYQADVMRVRAS